MLALAAQMLAGDLVPRALVGLPGDRRTGARR